MNTLLTHRLRPRALFLLGSLLLAAPSLHGQLSGTSFTDTNVVNGETYYYVIRAANFTGESPDSLPVSAQLVSLVPPNLSFTIGSGQLQFSWPGDHIGWRLQMNTNLSTTDWQDVPGTEAANYISIPLTNGNTFFRLVYP